MKRILIVDDEEDMLWMLQKNLSKGMDQVETLAASSGEEALAVLADKKVELVITDINMPGMSGLDLLIEISNRHPQTRVIIMTAYPSNTYEHTAKLSGCLKYIEKPFDIKEMRESAQEALTSDSPTNNSLDGIELLDILQFNGLSQATAALKISSPSEDGMIFFKNGDVVHAMCERTSGEEAFYKILKFVDATTHNMRGIEPPVLSIKKSLESLLFEATGQQLKSAVLEDLPQSADSPPLLSELDLLGGDAPPILDIPQKEDGVEDHTAAAMAIPEEQAVPRDTWAPQENQDSDDGQSDIEKCLGQFTDIDGVQTVCLIGRDGFLLHRTAKAGGDAELLAAITSSVIETAATIGRQLHYGSCNTLMLEYDQGPVLLAPAGEEAFLVIVATRETNLGWIRLSIRKNAEKIAEKLEQ